MPPPRVERGCPCGRQILSLLCLPIPPWGLLATSLFYIIIYSLVKNFFFTSYGPVGNRTLSQHQSSATRYKRVVSPTVESVIHIYNYYSTSLLLHCQALFSQLVPFFFHQPDIWNPTPCYATVIPLYHESIEAVLFSLYYHPNQVSLCFTIIQHITDMNVAHDD